MAGLKYELSFAVRTIIILRQNLEGLVTKKASTMRTNIIALELLTKLLRLLREGSSVLPCFDSKQERNEDGNAIEYDIP